MKNSGIFTISLDFELYWGVRDVVRLEDYKENIEGVHRAVPAMLDIFHKYNVHCTWATVGFLFFRSKEELLKALPIDQPRYEDARLNPYLAIDVIGKQVEDLFHFAPELIAKIKASPHQEIGTHTFSHFYCLEHGQTESAFMADLNAAKSVASKMGIELRSLVFPRNQFSESYLEVCDKVGITSYRGNPQSWLYSARSQEQESHFRRAIRLADAYLNLSGHHSSSSNRVTKNKPFNIPASRFLRPYSPKFSALEPLRIHRINRGLTNAAKTAKLYHLWWHPHNFGKNLEKNCLALTSILEHFSKLRDQYGMESLNMGEVAEKWETQP